MWELGLQDPSIDFDVNFSKPWVHKYMHNEVSSAQVVKKAFLSLSYVTVAYQVTLINTGD